VFHDFNTGLLLQVSKGVKRAFVRASGKWSELRECFIATFPPPLDPHCPVYGNMVKNLIILRVAAHTCKA